MKDVWKYLLVGLGIFFLVFLIGLLIIFGVGRAQYGMGPWMMGNYGGFGWLMMLGMILLLLLVVGAIVVGIVWLTRSMGGPATPLQSKPCPNCGKFVQVGWMACPYCGQKL